MPTTPKPLPQPSWGPRAAQDAGIDEALIFAVVHAFYGCVQADPLLGPVFAEKVHDWPAHLEKLCDFWSGVLLSTRRYKGKPMQMHQPLPIEEAHFSRWLSLFAETAQALCAPEAAALFVGRAEKIAQSLQMGIAFARDAVRDVRPALPVDAVAYKRTASFTPETLPPALQAQHSTRAGVWGLLVVESGCVRYAPEGRAVQYVRPGTPGVIVPEEKHAVQFHEPGACYVEFYKRPEALAHTHGDSGTKA